MIIRTFSENYMPNRNRSFKYQKIERYRVKLYCTSSRFRLIRGTHA
jgi:hypothetical protein